jgi:GT2 family glycosyltransferase
MKKVFISLLTFNDNKSTLDCLDSIETLKTESIKLSVVVVDNASENAFSVNKKYKNFELEIIRNEKNLGFSGGHNIGIKYALSEGADYVVVLNNDTILDRDLIINMLEGFKENVGVVVPKIYFAKGYEYHKDRYKKEELGKVIWYAGGKMDWKNVFGQHVGVDEVDRKEFNMPYETEIATGCCMMVKKEVFEKTGSLNQKYFLYYEDADFSMKIKKKGFKILYQPSAFLWHKNAASTGGSGSKLQDYYITRNRLYFGIRYAPLRAKSALFRESLRLARNGREWQKRAIKDFYKGIMGKGSFKNE